MKYYFIAVSSVSTIFSNTTNRSSSRSSIALLTFVMS